MLESEPVQTGDGVKLASYDNRWFNRGRPHIVELLWLALQALFVSSWLPGSWHRCFLLRLFGAKIGSRVEIKPGVQVKFPWKLTIGDHSWIGERVWIDNLTDVDIGSNCCLSQDAYLCAGSHDWTRKSFDLIVRPIVIGDGVWISARAVVALGVTVGTGAVVALGAVVTKDVAPWTICQGNPATQVGTRRLFDAPGLL